MPAVTIQRGTTFEDQGCSLMARVVGQDAAAITQASLAGITRRVYDASGTIVGSADSLTVADVVFDTLQTDDRWTVDDTGYNFKDDVAASVFTDPDTHYRVEYQFDPASGEDWFVVFDVSTVGLHTS